MFKLLTSFISIFYTVFKGVAGSRTGGVLLDGSVDENKVEKA